jgi:hypothetical protein
MSLMNSFTFATSLSPWAQWVGGGEPSAVTLFVVVLVAPLLSVGGVSDTE